MAFDGIAVLAACAIALTACLAFIVVLRRRLAASRSKLEEGARALQLAQHRESQLRQADAAKDQFIATLGHELRNPLNALYAAAYVLDRAMYADPMVAPAAAPHERHRILLVEDHAETRNAMFAALALDGHRVYEAADGSSGLRTLTAVKPDVAVIDLGLPDLSGFELAQAMCATPERERMVLIAVTGFERPETLRRAREAGFDEYVAKPIAPDQLSRLIDAAWRSRRARLS